jgi:hypothetical protein
MTQGGLGSVSHIEFAQNRRDMVVHGAPTDAKRGGDGCIAVTEGDEIENLVFAAGKRAAFCGCRGEWGHGAASHC